MADNGKLKLTLTDVNGKRLKEEVDVILRSLDLSDVTRNSIDASKVVTITGLHAAPQGRYRIEIDPPSYQSVSFSFNMKPSGITSFDLTFPIDPDKVTKVNFPTFTKLPADLRQLLQKSANVLAFVGKSGQELYEAIDDIRRAGMLNVATKCAATIFASNGRSVLSYVQEKELQELRGDRFFAVVPKELREETKNSVHNGLFSTADESLHHPPPGFTHAGSFKTSDHAGNLQLTFHMKGDDCVADIDIDDANGFGHIFQVLRNKLSGKPTHPYNIHEILIAAQQLDPGYTFEL